MVQVTFQWAVTGKAIAHKIRARPGTKVFKLLCEFCAATGRVIEETRLVLNGKCLRNKDTLARSGLQGQVSIGVVHFDPWEDVSSWLSKPLALLRAWGEFTPRDNIISAIKPGDCVKIALPPEDGIPGENFWTVVVSADDGFVRARVDNVLMTIDWPKGKCIQFTVDRMYAIW